MTNVPASPRPWKVVRDPVHPYYTLLDAEGNEIARFASYTGKRKPNSFQQEVNLELTHSNVHLVANVINQG